MRPDPVALCVIRFQRRGQRISMTVKTSHDVASGGPDSEYVTLDIEDVVQTVRRLAAEHGTLPQSADEAL
jgi:hypothetical protein